MYRVNFSFLSGLMVILMSSLPQTVKAENREERYQSEITNGQGNEVAAIGVGFSGRSDRGLRSRTAYRYQPYSVRYNSPYVSSYGTYNYGYPYSYSYPSYSSYSTYPLYSNPYAYPGYGGYYYNPGMYNPDTIFVNPPSSMNYPTGYPGYSETYIYR